MNKVRSADEIRKDWDTNLRWKNVKRDYLEINSLQDLKEVKQSSEDYSLRLLQPINFQLNKFFYKNIGQNHQWIDRLVWTENQWIDYVSSQKVKTYIFKYKDDLAGFFELIFSILLMGVPKEYKSSKLIE